MLTYLSLENFVFIDELALDFNAGMTALTGETGAGKSILCDALWLALGATCDKTVIQIGKPYCRVQASFNIRAIPQVQQWLIAQGYMNDEEIEQAESVFCHITRVISPKGRGQVWINHQIAKVKHVQRLGEYLVARHSQHDQQRLLMSEHQRECLDRYGRYADLLQKVADGYTDYTAIKKEQQRLLAQVETQKDQLSLLQYQLDEIEQAALKPNEWEDLSQKQRQLSYAHQVLEKGQEALMLLSEAEPVHLSTLLQSIQQALHKIVHLDNRFESIYNAIMHASIELMEAETALRYTLSEVVVDPEQLRQVDERLFQLNGLARKHGVKVEALDQLTLSLQQEHEHYEQSQAALEACGQALAKCLKDYQGVAAQLTHAREGAATALEQAITEKIQSLGMPGARFKIQLTSLVTGDCSKEPSGFGNERVTFYLSAAPGQPLQSLTKGASGGELSRLSLVIQTLMAESTTVPTLVFDEVDVGVGGSVAEKMGRLLQALSKTQQVLCITHLPQVAVLAQYHYRIEKQTQDQTTVTRVFVLESLAERVQEIARMLGGIHITDKTIAHAKSILMVEPES
jgi:DNA repair protein RecN (Recombination protein N)